MDANMVNALQGARRHVLGALDGLAPADVHRSLLPSGWTPLGLVNHLTLDVERFWFRAVVEGDPEVIAWFDSAPDAWKVPSDVAPEAVLAAYREEAERCDAVLAGTEMDSAPAWWPGDLFGDFRMDTVAEIVLHVLGETASHAGHLDIVRELTDGRQWMVLT